MTPTTEIRFPKARKRPQKRSGMMVRFRPELVTYIKKSARISRMHVKDWLETAVCLHGDQVQPGLAFRIVLLEEQSVTSQSPPVPSQEKV